MSDTISNRAITPAPVRKSVHVKAPPERAFEVFARGMTTWWLPSHKIGATPFAEIVVEPRQGGRWFERGRDGVDCQWGTVLAWEPPTRLLLGWQLTAEWKFDPAMRTEVDIRFTAEDGGTRVDLEHRNLDRFGTQADAVSAAVTRGWSALLEAYAQAV